jgi:ferrous iron transport protein A
MIKVGEVYRVISFSKDCPRSYMQKLISMGFIPGAKFQISRKAPLGNPFQIEIQGYFVSMRETEIELINAEKI